MGMNATAGGGGADLVQEGVNAPEFRQVRAAQGRNTLLLYGCYNCPEEVPQGCGCYKNVGLSKSLRLLVLQLGLGSVFLTVFLLRCVLVYPLPLTIFFSSALFTWSLFCYSSCLVLRLCRRLL